MDDVDLQIEETDLQIDLFMNLKTILTVRNDDLGKSWKIKDI